MSSYSVVRSVSIVLSMPKFADVVRAARNALGWSQERLALEADLSPGWVGQIETGKISRPEPPNLRKLADALKVTYGSLALAVYEADDVNLEAKLLEMAAMPTTQARRSAFSALPASVQRSILVLMGDHFADAKGQITEALRQLNQESES